MKLFEALNQLTYEFTGAKDRGIFKVFISDGKMPCRLVLTIDAEKLTFSAHDNKYYWTKTGDEAGYTLSIALMIGYEVSRLEWHGIDRITGLADNKYYDETAEEWHDL